MYITTTQLLSFLDNNSTVSTASKYCWKSILKSIDDHEIIEFTTEEELYDFLNSLSTSLSSQYLLMGLINAYTTYIFEKGELDNNSREMISNVYHTLNKLSKEVQYKNRISRKIWDYDTLLEKMHTLTMDTWKSMITKVMMAMYLLIPPVRQDYYHVQLVTNELANENNNNNSFLNMDTGYIQFYSTKSKKIIKTQLPIELLTIIRDSVKLYPRSYLFTRENGKDWSNKLSMYYALTSLLRKYLNDSQFSINTFRHVYTRWSFTMSPEERSRIAKEMLHSDGMHMRYV